MVQTITVDVINSNAMVLLKDLELLKLIRVNTETTAIDTTINWKAKYKGKMTKQPIAEIDNQLNELRNAWE